MSEDPGLASYVVGDFPTNLRYYPVSGRPFVFVLLIVLMFFSLKEKSVKVLCVKNSSGMGILNDTEIRSMRVTLLVNRLFIVTFFASQTLSTNSMLLLVSCLQILPCESYKSSLKIK